MVKLIYKFNKTKKEKTYMDFMIKNINNIMSCQIDHIFFFLKFGEKGENFINQWH
jgi:hypothetical protein